MCGGGGEPGVLLWRGGSQGSEPSAPPNPGRSRSPPLCGANHLPTIGVMLWSPMPRWGRGGMEKRLWDGGMGGEGTEHGLGAKGKGQKMHLGTRDGDGGDVGTLLG